MREQTIKLYRFDELSEEAKEKAVEQCSEYNVDYDWWNCTYEDAKTIGIKITSFDDHNITGDYIESPLEVIRLIKENHGKECETYKTAISYEKQFLALPKDEEGYVIEDDDLENDFRNAILEDYRIMLNKEYEYLMSKEAIIETIECNEYEFTVEGKRY